MSLAVVPVYLRDGVRIDKSLVSNCPDFVSVHCGFGNTVVVVPFVVPFSCLVS